MEAILKRRSGDEFKGDFAAELWSLEHLPRPWAEDEQVEAALVSLFDVYRKAGYATKQSGSYEPIMAGDQLIACGDEAVPRRRAVPLPGDGKDRPNRQPRLHGAAAALPGRHSGRAAASTSIPTGDCRSRGTWIIPGSTATASTS